MGGPGELQPYVKSPLASLMRTMCFDRKTQQYRPPPIWDRERVYGRAQHTTACKAHSYITVAHIWKNLAVVLTATTYAWPRSGTPGTLSVGCTKMMAKLTDAVILMCHWRVGLGGTPTGSLFAG